jgi:hypothetical protein
LHPGVFSGVPNLYPGLTSWATLSRPYGTHLERVVFTHPLKPRLKKPAAKAGGE